MTQRPCNDQVLESTNPDKGNIPHNQNDLDSTNDKGLTDCNVQKDNIGQTINKGKIDNETLENLVENPNINILGEATIEENKTDKSSKLCSSISSDVLLSEFDETVEYPSQKGSESSSSGSSPHTDEDDEKHGQSSRSGAIPKNMLDLSLKPKLITLSTPVSTPHQRMHRKPRHMYAKPTHKQPSRAKKQASNYLPNTDDSSIESDNNSKDGDLIPEGVTGKIINIFHCHIC